MLYQLGIFGSWEILSETIAIKHCDTSFIRRRGSSIPKPILWFWNIDESTKTNKNITLKYNGKDYLANISYNKLSCHLTWDELSKGLSNIFSLESYYEIRFEKIKLDYYRINLFKSPYSKWDIKTENLAIKRYREPIYSIPAGFSMSKTIMNFWGLNDSKVNIIIVLQYNNKDFFVVFRPPTKPLCRYIYWNELKEYLIKHIDLKRGISYIKFEKLGINHYRVSFWDINNINLDIPMSNDRLEGKKLESYSTRYERDSNNRSNAIRIHRTKCMACGFDFEEVYGELGKGFIEVHHIKPLSTLDEEIVINPATDLICLCSNCHRMIHRGKNLLSLEALRLIIQSNKINEG